MDALSSTRDGAALRRSRLLRHDRCTFAAPYSANSTILEIVSMSCCVKGLYRGILRLVGQVARHTSLVEQAAGGMGDVETLVRLIEVGTDSMNLRGFQLMSGGKVTPRQVDALVLFLNGRWCSALGRLCCGSGRGPSRPPPPKATPPETELVSPLL